METGFGPIFTIGQADARDGKGADDPSLTGRCSCESRPAAGR
jgi:hypothetical protein